MGEEEGEGGGHHTSSKRVRATFPDTAARPPAGFARMTKTIAGHSKTYIDQGDVRADREHLFILHSKCGRENL